MIIHQFFNFAPKLRDMKNYVVLMSLPKYITNWVDIVNS
jgi:hypothetical protein